MRYLILLIILLNISMISGLSYELQWDDEEIVNGKEFVINVVVNDAEDRYDGKLWIEDDGDIISDRYDSNNDEWKSSYYYINDYFEDGENEVILRIDEDSDFHGDAVIHFRFRGEEEISEDIEILGKELGSEKGEIEDDQKEDLNDNDVNNEEIIEESLSEQESSPIILGQKIDTLEEKDINSEVIVYQSKGTYVVKYSVYGFTALCVLLCVLIIWRKID